MLSKKNLEELKLTEEQLKKYEDFVRRRSALRDILLRAKVHNTAIIKILEKSDLNRVDLNNLEALEEDVKESFSEFILKG
jgi:hypothetical protein